MKKIGTPRPPKKDGAIKFQYGRNDGDLDFMVLFGNDVPRCDRALVMNVFTSQRPFLDSSARIGIAFADSFVVELENRGYDISTLRFSVERGGRQNETNHRRPVDSCVKRGMCNFVCGGGVVSDARLDELRVRLKNVIIGTCNKVGCKSCGLKFEGGCSATELENEIMDLEMKED